MPHMPTPDAQLVAFGREVRRRRNALGLTSEQLAERADLSTNYLITIELGKRDPSLSTIESIARGLGVPPGELLGGVKSLNPAGLEAASLFDSVPADLRQGVLHLLRAVSTKR